MKSYNKFDVNIWSSQSKDSPPRVVQNSVAKLLIVIILDLRNLKAYVNICKCIEYCTIQFVRVLDMCEKSTNNALKKEASI